MENELLKKLPLMFLSIVLAFVLWVVIRNVIEPIIDDYENVKIIVKNEEELLKMNKVYKLDTEVCRVSYKVKEKNASSIRNNDFEVYIDLANVVNDGKVKLQHVEYKDAEKLISDIKIQPEEVRIILSDVLWKEFPVEYNLKGQIEEGLKVSGIVCNPKTIFVSGVDEELEKISKISIDIPIDGKLESFNGIDEVELFDDSGKSINTKDFTFSKKDINYTVQMYATLNITLNAIVDGNVKKGYTYAGTHIYPNSIMVTGPKSIVDNIQNPLDLPIINIDDLDSNKEFSFNVLDLLPVGTESKGVGEIVVEVMVNDNVINSSLKNIELEGPK